MQNRLKAAQGGEASAAQKVRVPYCHCERTRACAPRLAHSYSLSRLTWLSSQTATDQIIKGLQRENALIATAWYDLTSRLQSNHVVLQRRHDAPRSWLNKQRQMVNGQLRQRDLLYLY